MKAMSWILLALIFEHTMGIAGTYATREECEDHRSPIRHTRTACVRSNAPVLGDVCLPELGAEAPLPLCLPPRLFPPTVERPLKESYPKGTI